MEDLPAAHALLQPGWRRTAVGSDAFWAGLLCVLPCCAHAPGLAAPLWASHPFWAGLLTVR